MKKHQAFIEVLQEHLDDLEHVNNVVYLQWVQNIAAEHWFALASDVEDLKWVVRKHEIEYFAPAFLHDHLMLETWVEGMEGISSFRRVRILKGDQVVCSCLSQWIMLDAKSMRPKRITSEIAGLFV